MATIVAGALMLAGALIRVRAYLAHAPFFVDEVLLEQNLLARSWSQLWQPLDFAQTAPPLFLVVVKAIASIFGYGEHVLRALPLLAGCLLLPFAWFVSRQLLQREESMLVVALLALSPTAIYYDNSFKQYASDMLVPLAIIGTTLSAVRRPTPRRLLIVGIAGVVYQLFSSTTAFLLAGVGAALVMRAARSRERRLVLAVGAMGISWLAVHAALMRTAYRRLGDAGSPVSEYMHGYWSRDFLLHSPHSVTRAMSHLFDGVFFALPGDEAFGLRTVAVAALLILGTVVLARAHGREVAALLAVPLLVLVFSSIAGRYPLGTRLVLFTAPLTAICVAAGAGVVLRRVPTVGRVGLVGALLIFPVRTGFFLLRHPLATAPSADTVLIRTATSLSAPGSDAVYLRGRDIPVFVYYARADTAIGRRLLHLIDQENPATLFPDLQRLGAWQPAVPDSALMTRIEMRTVLVGRPRVKNDTIWGGREAQRIKAASTCTDVFAGAVAEDAAQLSSAIEELGGAITNLRHDDARTSFRACYPQ